MSDERPRLQHWLVCTWAEPADPTAPGLGPFRLHDVSPQYALPAGVTFPAPDDPAAGPPVLPGFDVFARFVGGSGRTDFEVRVYWMDAPEGRREVETVGPYIFAFTPEDHRDAGFHLARVPVPGAGWYSVELIALPGVGPDGRPDRDAEPVTIGVDTFYLMEAPE